LFLLESTGAIGLGECADRLDDLIYETRAASGDEQAVNRWHRRRAARKGWETRRRRQAEAEGVLRYIR
jgi:hypothetical protein